MKDIGFYTKIMGFNLTNEQNEIFQKYQELLIDWNTKVNLTAITDPQEIALKHFADSLTVLPFILKSFNKNINTGAVSITNLEKTKDYIDLNTDKSTEKSTEKTTEQNTEKNIELKIGNITEKSEFINPSRKNENSSREIFVLNNKSNVKNIELNDIFADFSSLSLIDVGTGAGFPGIPLKIVCPGLNVTLMDSLNKRISFLDDVISKTQLKGIKTVHSRAEDGGHNKEHREKYDIAIARAVANMPVLCEYCMPFVKIGGVFIAMKANADEEMELAGYAIRQLGGVIESKETLFLPDSDIKRSIIIIRKISKTPPVYPRKAGKPEKEPLVKKNSTKRL